MKPHPEGNARVAGEPLGIVGTMNALVGPLSPAFIVGFPSPVQLSTTNATSAFVVATQDPAVTEALARWNP